MPEGISVVRYAIHKAFAYPYAISWIIATIAIWTPLSIELAASGAFKSLWDDWTTIPLLMLLYACTSGLGFFAGLFVAGIALETSRLRNGAPHEIEEKVVILSGPHAGWLGFIRNFTIGQGGQSLARVELGKPESGMFVDFLEDHEVLRLSPRRAAQHSGA